MVSKGAERRDPARCDNNGQVIVDDNFSSACTLILGVSPRRICVSKDFSRRMGVF
jgi:hypothetical protein